MFSPSLAQDVSLEVKRALNEFEPRVDLLACDVTDNSEYNSIRLDIHYFICTQTNSETQSLVLTI